METVKTVGTLETVETVKTVCNFSRLSFLNVSLSVRVQIRINAYSKL